MEHVDVIDSDLDEEIAKSQNPDFLCSEEVLDGQVVLPVKYWSFDSKLHQGQLVIDKKLVPDIIEVFEVILRERFPLESVIPAADPRFRWDDEVLMDKDNTSSFNYRVIADEGALSLHAFGRAIDINPRLNPYINRQGIVKPAGAIRDLARAGIIAEDSFLVKLFDKLGWEWGGRFSDVKDWHHFQKPL